jgi:hemerythrin-like domain-containing protein
METIQPLKRDEGLIPFSHDHHHGLRFCRKVKEQIKNNMAPSLIAAFICQTWEDSMKKHFQEEETLLLPLLSPADPLRIKTEKDHLGIKALVETIEANPDIIYLRFFAEKLIAHIRFEERKLFPYLQKTGSFSKPAQQ